jgi:methyl-accepting chemotaxis protein
MSGLVGTLAAAVNGQAARLGEVNGAVAAMDDVTQQNAAMVEEATAALHGLAGEAARLDQLVGRFSLGGASAQRSVRAA